MLEFFVLLLLILSLHLNSICVHTVFRMFVCEQEAFGEWRKQKLQAFSRPPHVILQFSPIFQLNFGVLPFCLSARYSFNYLPMSMNFNIFGKILPLTFILWMIFLSHIFTQFRLFQSQTAFYLAVCNAWGFLHSPITEVFIQLHRSSFFIY